MGLSFLRQISGKGASAGTTTVRSERIHAVAGRELPLRVFENPRAKRLTLRIEAGGRGLRITVPPGLPEREVLSFLNRHEGWIESRIAKLPDQPGVRAGIKIPLRGVPHKIVHQPGRGTTQLLEGNILLVHGDPAHLPRRVADHIKREVKREIEALVIRHTATVGRKAKAVRFKDTKSRWGSCTSDGVLSFSWRIGMAPAPIINYLVAHEVAHLIEMNHGPKFWKLCHELCPDTERCKAWLKRNGSALQAIDFT
ncbi:M48 family metallopeptidase [Brucella tritici]|uniref:M48 family metallopeptidase n=1 Tax=Brucella tritici TaxID=94626 RepID=A0A833CLV0_9HYPH|nr:M48 family metallopeptidase [Brucella tritici]KAB2664884.1 M48 family metallopeptidase [Brucella tritici]KAB2677637.1 M48 family metallopeptidase [Brucella tritici]